DDLSFPAHGVEDPQLPAVPADHPGVARLAASPGVEDGAVQDDDPVADLEDVALGPVQIAVAAGEFFDLHHQSFRWTTRATLCGPIDNRAEGPSRRHRKPHRAGRAKLSPVDAAMHRYPLECIRRQFMSKRLIRLLALLSVLAVVAAACGDGGAEDTTTSVADTTPTTEAEAPTTTEAEAPTTTAAEEETPAGDFEPVPMKIGTLLPQTGQLSAIIDALLLPIDMGVEEINEAYPGLVTVEHFDSGTDPAVASENVDQILTGDFNGMIGAAASGVSTAIVDKVQTAEMAMCSGSNTGASLTQYDPYYIRTAPTDELQAPTLGDLMINDGITNAAVIWRNDEYGVGFGEALADYLEDSGVTVSVRQGYDPQQSSFSALIDEIANAGAEGLAMITFEEGGQIVLDMQGRFDGTVYVADGFVDTVGAEQLGGEENVALLEGFRGTYPSVAPENGEPTF